MGKTTNILRSRSWLLLLALFVLLMPQQAAADDGYDKFTDMSYNYNVYVSGTNTVTISVPLYDQEGADAWIKDGNLYASWEGQPELNLFHWAISNSSGIASDVNHCPTQLYSEAPGYFNVKLGNTNGVYRLDPGSMQSVHVARNSDGVTFELSAVWVLPQEILGKTVKLRWRVQRTGTSRSTVWLDEYAGLKPPQDIQLPEANPVSPAFISMATINNNSKGKIGVPWSMLPTKIDKLRYEYTDANNRVISKDMPTSSNSGMIELNAYEPHRNFRIIADYYEQQSVGEYLIKDVVSEPQDISMIHAPHGLTVTPLGGVNSKVEVKWSIGNTTDEDISEIDFFEIQRSLTGKEEDFVTIGQEPFARNGDAAKNIYTFVDSTFVDAIAESMLKDGYTLENLTYRVRRTLTQGWGWGIDNPCSATAKCVIDNIHLLRFADYTPTPEDEHYNVRVAWQYADEHNAVWDDRAKMMMRLTLKNGVGDTVEVKEIQLNQDEREQRYKVVSLSRPCVNYDIELYVDRGTSPLNLFNAEKMKKAYFMPIHNADDWNTFRQEVMQAGGKYPVNARLYADISTVSSAGDETYPYNGIFDGNGHTLTINIDYHGKYQAPFRYVGNATFHNLHTVGTIKSSDPNISGLIGMVMADSTVTIENCRSSININSTYNGETKNGGFISNVGSGSRVLLRNCKFDAGFDGENSFGNGGFIGWAASNSNITIDNSLFAPSHINTANIGCDTWARIDNTDGANVTLHVMNSYSMREYTSLFTIYNAADWHKFKKMVEDAKNQYDVNAVLAADITVSDYVGGSETAYYRGTFNGGGHTITFNMSGFSEEQIAPFRYVGATTTIRNLHTAGTITASERVAAGLIAETLTGSTVSIENCRSSVTINSSVNGDATNGGFVGGLNGTVTIRNSKFDGSFEGVNSHSNGGFVGWVNSNSTLNIENCLFEPDHISTKFENCATWARKSNAPSALVKVTNSQVITEYSPTRIIIRNASDWERFAQLVDAAKNNHWVDAILQADITTDKSVGLSGAPWRGTLHGNGHTININIQSPLNRYASLFPQARDVTITDLHVTGTVNGGGHAAGLIGGVADADPPVTLNRVWVSVETTAANSDLAGGIIGHSDRGTVNMNDCLFDGKVTTNNTDNSWAGEIIGWCNGGNWSLQRVYDNGTPLAKWMFYCVVYISGDGAKPWGTNESSFTVTRHTWDNVNKNSMTDQSAVVGLMNSRRTGTWHLVDGKAVPIMNTTEKTLTAAELVATLGKYNWKVVDGKAVPYSNSPSETGEDDPFVNLATWTKVDGTVVPTTTTATEPDYSATTPPVIKDSFYHSSTGKIDKELLTETLQSSVVLTWNTDGNPIDYFTVQRREVGIADTTWVNIATNLDQMTYEDKTVSPLKTYQYRVCATADCEGQHFTHTDPTNGACKNTGRLEGYVRFNDGTGIPDITVNITGGSVQTSVVTDESGHYVADELPYQGTTRITYKVTAGKIQSEVNTYNVTFDEKTNDVLVHEITATNGCRFSGYVTYEGTSIPVKGVNFLLDGKRLHNAAGKYVETDEEGNFSFRVVPDDHTIQVVKDGHTFVNNGMYSRNFSGDVASINFHDATKVKLIGRVVGGTDQGNMPMGNNLSKNNLGDDLQMVMTLEGDTKSWLVYDNRNPERTERDTVYMHAGNKGHQTKVKTYRKRMEVTPDPATGEYILMLPPVRWKVQQVYCKGYPTLFQEGQVSEVIDLTNSLATKDTTYVGSYMDVDGNTVYQPKATYNAIYNRIYRNPVELTYKQLGYDAFDYFGDKNYTSTTLSGDKVKVPLAYKNPADTTKALYTFGHPVFSLERKYFIQVQVAESYPYNNDLASEKIDYVRIGGGVATMHNGMRQGVAVDTLHLDSLGQGTFMLKADQVAQPVGRENALKTVTFSALQDGTHFEAEPLQGYVLNLFPIGSGKELLTDGQPILFDILRDPPGAYSSATLSKGASLNSSYSMHLAMEGGVSFSFTWADKYTWFHGDVGGTLGWHPPLTFGDYSGDFLGSERDNEKVDVQWTELIFNYEGTKAWSYTMNINNNVSTSADPSMVGADADLYIGMVQNVQVTPLSSIHAISDSLYQSRIAQTGIGNDNPNGEVAQYADYGTLVHLAEGEDADGNKFHLVRDISLGYGPKIKSQFIYSQKQILEEIIPDKVKEIFNLLYVGTQEDAQQIANSTGKAVYRSLREPTDPMFGYRNYVYNTDIMEANDSTHYVIVLPFDKKPADYPDQIIQKSEIIYAWTKMIAQNEREKLNATDLLTSYDIAGAQSVNYSETFTSNYTNSTAMYFPFGVQPDYFPGQGSGIGTSIAMNVVNYGLGALCAYFESMKRLYPKITSNSNDVNRTSGTNATMTFEGSFFKWFLLPVLKSKVVGTNSTNNSYTRTESFNISLNPTSRLSVDVYRIPMSNIRDLIKKVGPEDVFSTYNFEGLSADAIAMLKDKSNAPDFGGPSRFIYRTRGGYTSAPWEDQRKTHFYEAGSILDERTLKIDNPTISLDKHSVSGVSVNDAARFTVYIANESEKPEATGGVSVYQLFAADGTNPNGAKLSVNGQPLTTGGMSVNVVPGKTTELQLEVRPGNGFDYEGLTIGVVSPSDALHAKATTKFDVHFLREAGAVSISAPADKWVLNTFAQKDPDRGWYIPVTISNFDRHQHNFDHIEFQYKETQRGDDSWTNLCSFYADSTLMANANGICKLMEPNGNIVTEFFGDGTVMERSYDLRAVLFTRNGGTFLTSSSKVISGVKDTRRPQLFGTPEPKSGILNLNDDIVFNFSEDIENNNLSEKTNFEVKGEVNNNALSEMVSLQFTGQSSVESEARRNFSGKDLTIDLRIRPDTLTGRDMPLFSHGTNGHKLQLWLTKDFLLKAVVNGQTFMSDSTIKPNAFRHVGVSINQKDSTLLLYYEDKTIGKHKMKALYSGTGPLIFGRTNELNRNQSQYYEGRMMEARLWYRAMDIGLFDTYGLQRLTGYEKDLVDYYPMNEGSGDYVTDHTQGANAKLIGATWAMPHGMSLHLEKEDNGMEMTDVALNRTSDHDYTLMFWFKTDSNGRGTLLSNGNGTKEESDARNRFNLGFDGDKLMYRSNGFAAHVEGDWSDNRWHHYAMTVNRARNIVNIYVDKELRTSFAADSLGGISGKSYIGATEGGNTPLKGNIDELIVFAQALPETLVKTYATKSPNGDEKGLIAYLSFEHQERNQMNEIVMTPYVYSKKIYLDDKDNIRYQEDPVTHQPTGIPVRDYLFTDNINKILAHIDETMAAPVMPYEEVTNLKFDFIGRGNQILVDLDEKAAKLNHRNIYVTLRDVEDRNGNTMASPQTACYYVTNSSLQWLANRRDATIMYGTGEDDGQELKLPFFNNSATVHNYIIENCPRWLILDKYSDVIAPQSYDAITAKVNKDLNIGTYNEIIYLTDENGITEPLYLNLTVEGEQPEWSQGVNSDLLENSMSISGEVYLYDELDTDSRDIVGVFDNDNVCHGFANISYNAQSGDHGLFLTVYDNQKSGRPLKFRLWQYSTGREIVLTTTPAITFTKDATLGTDKPVRFEGGEAFIQNFKLSKGWNWVSFNVESEQLSDMDALLSSMHWNDGDIITELGGSMTMTYEGDKKQWVASKSTSNWMVSPRKSYAIKVQEDCLLPIGGTIIKDKSARTILVKHGWNAIGYTPIANLTVETALSDYYDHAQQGDVIKSHTEFAYFTKSGNTGRWRGSLQYMKPGEGYMLLRKDTMTTSFVYPFYELNSYFREDWTSGNARRAPVPSSYTMSVSAVVEGVETEDGDVLVAYSNGVEAGSVVINSQLSTVNYLSIAGENSNKIWFAIEREGEIVASTGEVMTFKTNDVVGSPDTPTTINFVKSDYENGQWFTISGMPLPKKPAKKGLYIFNGKKVVVK